MLKPMLACDWDEDKIKFPVWLQPKIDGVRGMNLEGRLTGRSLKEHGNVFTTELFSKNWFKGLDGEFACGPAGSPSLCRDTTSAMSTINGEPYCQWHVFDLVTEFTMHQPYRWRYQNLKDHVETLKRHQPAGWQRIVLMPYMEIPDMATLDYMIEYNLDHCYEGSILRDPNGMYKQGRSTIREGGLLRIKGFVDAEAVVLEVLEGQENQNEAKVNELGHTERSTEKIGMVPNGMVGKMRCKLSTDVEHRGTTLFKGGCEIIVSAGRLTHPERRQYFMHPEQIVGKTIKFQTFPIGIKDKPRMPTFQSIRSPADMSV